MPVEDIVLSLSAHRRLLQVLISEAILICPTVDGVRYLEKTVKATQNQNIRTMWLTALPRVRSFVHRRAPVASLARIEELEKLRHEWQGEISVAIVEPTRAWLLGVAENEVVGLDVVSDIEIVRYDAIDLSSALTTHRAILGRDVLVGSNRETVWTERFAALAMSSQHVTILDRYIGKAMVEGRCAGLTWLVDHIAKDGPATLALVTGTGQAYAVSDIKRAADLTLGNAAHGLVSVKLIIAPDRAFFEAHARHVRFDRSAAVLVEPGIDVFNNTYARQTFPCPLIEADGAIRRENAIRQRRVFLGDLKINLWKHMQYCGELVLAVRAVR